MKKKKTKSLKSKKVFKYNYIELLVVIILLFMNIGFALYHQELGLNGNITLKVQGKLKIISATIVNSESTNLAEYNNPTIDDMNISFKLSASAEPFEATYLIEIANGSQSDYTLASFPFNAISNNGDTINMKTAITDASNGTIIDPGETILAGERKIYKVKFTVETISENTEININGNAIFLENNTGSILSSIDPTTGDLRENKIACFTVSVANTYSYNRKFNLLSSNENIILVNSDGSNLETLQVSATSTEEFPVCTKTLDSSSFLTDSTSTIITLKSTGISDVNVGELTLKVDKDIVATDKEAPKVGNVIISIPEENIVEGKAIVSWDRIDSGGSSITNYYVILYNTDLGTSSTYKTDSSSNSYTLTNMNEGNYYAKVYGVDEAGNIGSSFCDSATTADGYCSMSNTTSLKWKYMITFELTKLSHDGETTTSVTTLVNQSYSTTLAVNSSSTWDLLPSSVTITMGGNTLISGTDYTYSSSSGVITINKIISDVTITAGATSVCLIKGTKITLSNGKTKNIEDITYNDLLLVWNYETGSYTYEYPIWIEKGKTTTSYQKTTFSDGNVLKTVGNHGVFSKDINQFVTVNDQNNFKIGTRIAKIDENNKINYVKVVNIEIVYEEVEYYHVVSTRYYNIFANNILTTDGTVLLSNLYEFDDNIKWVNRDYSQLDLYSYSLFSDIMPYYLFKGLRVEEGKVLSKYLDLNTFKTYLLQNQLNDDMLLKPYVNLLGNRVWMVTTSDDDVTNGDYLLEEGTYYNLKEPKNKNEFKYWLNTSDNKIYFPNDKVEVVHGMHFIAIY